MPYILVLFFTALALPQSRYSHFGPAQGLSQLNVRSVLQDKEGFIWAGTWDGLNRYDGYTFRRYQHDFTDSNSLPNNNIMALTLDAFNRLWIQFPDGRLSIYSKQTDRFSLIRTRTGLPLFTETYQPPLPDQEGFLWACSHDTLIRINPENLELQYYAAKKFVKPASGSVPAIVLASQNKILLKYGSSQYFFKETPFEFYSLYYTQSKRILLSTTKGELYEYLPQTDKFQLLTTFHSPFGTSAQVFTYYEDNNKRLWIGTPDGLYFTDHFAAQKKDLKFESFPYGTGGRKISEPVYSIHKDRSGVLWVGAASGLYKVNPVRKKFAYLPSNEKYFELFGDSYPLGIVSLGNGKMLIGATDGLFEYDMFNERSVKFTPANSGYTGQRANYIYQADDGTIWIGTNSGLSRYYPSVKRFTNYSFVHHSAKASFKSSINAVTSSPDNRIWAGGVGALIEFNPENEEYRTHTFPSEIKAESSSFILSLLSEGSFLWAGTNGEGLLKINIKDMSYIRFAAKAGDPGSLSGNKIMAIHRDRKDRLWIATMGGGVNLLDSSGTSFRHFTTKEGLSNNTVYGIIEDDQGNLWFSTNDGLNRINGESLSLSVFGSDDLPGITEFNQNSYYKSSDGQIWFGGMSGIISFRPEDIAVNPHPPVVTITDFLLFNKSRPDLLKESGIRLQYNENFFSFELAALLFDFPASHQYAYRLEGLHDEWMYLGKRRTVDFSYIEPGEYIFWAKAANEDEIWSEPKELARVVIVPPFWRTTWFYSLIFILLATTLALGIRTYIRRKYKMRIAELEKEKLILEERNKTRNRIARDLHDDLASTVSSAGLYLQSARQMLADDQKAAMLYLEKSTSILNKAEQAMGDIVWSVAPNYDSLDNLILRIRLVAQEMCTAAGIRYEMSSSGENHFTVSEEIRRNIYLSVKECISNAVRHSGCTELKITIELSFSQISVTVSDNGRGFSLSDEAVSLGGNGVKNIRKRLQEISGSAQFQSEVGNGTSIIISAPLPPQKK